MSTEYNLEALLSKLDKEGKIRTLSLEESKKIYAHINEGLPEFVAAERNRNNHSTQKIYR